MTQQPPLTGPARKLVDLLAEHPDGLTVAQLAEHARARFAGLAAARVAQLVSQAVAAGAVTDTSGRLRAVPASDDGGDGTGTAAPRPARTGPLRAFVVDLESVVRTTAVEPFTEKRIFQVGAVRAGADIPWVSAAPRFSAWVALPDDEWVITSDPVRAAHAAGAVPPVEALAAMLAFAADADVVVAYSGTDADFPLLAEACDREGLPRLGGEYADAYYLTLSAARPSPPARPTRAMCSARKGAHAIGPGISVVRPQALANDKECRSQVVGSMYALELLLCSRGLMIWTRPGGQGSW